MAISLLVSSAISCAGAPEPWVNKAQQPKSNRLPVQHHLCHQWPSHLSLCQLFSAQVHQNFEAQQSKSNRQPVQHHLHCQLPSQYLFCQLFPGQALQNSERTKRSRLNQIDNLYNIICAISGHLTSHCIRCFLCRRTRTLSRLGAAA